MSVVEGVWKQQTALGCLRYITGNILKLQKGHFGAPMSALTRLHHESRKQATILFSCPRLRQVPTSFYRATLYASAVYAVVACPSVCPPVRLSVRHKPVLYRNDWTKRAEFWHEGFLPLIPHRVIRKFGYLQKWRVLPSGTWSQTPDLDNFAMASRSRCQQNWSSSSSSTV